MTTAAPPVYQPGLPYSSWTRCCPLPCCTAGEIPEVRPRFGGQQGRFLAAAEAEVVTAVFGNFGGRAGVFSASATALPVPVPVTLPRFGVLSHGVFSAAVVKPDAVAVRIWQPTDLVDTVTPWVRPTGPGFVTWESIVGPAEAQRQAAAPATPTLLTQALLATPSLNNAVLTLPKGQFRYPSGHTQPNTVAWGFGQGYGNLCRGVAGSGAGGVQAHSRATVLQQLNPGPAGAGTLIRINKVADPYFAGLSLIGVQTRGDGAYDTAVMIATCTGHPVLEHLYVRGASPGYANAPPGETFGVSIYRTPNATIRDCEFDGRDAAGARTMASPIGWNTVVNDDLSVVHVQRVYTHHGLAGMLTFWETTNVWTEDYYTYSWSSNTGSLSGSGINHEQSGGRIRHIRPRLFLNSTKSAGPVIGAYGHPAADTSAKQPNTSSCTFGIASGLADVGANFEMWYPQWDNTVGNSGILAMAGYDAYSLGNKLVTAPKIYLRNAADTADYLLAKVDHPANNWSNLDPRTYYAWIH